MRKKGKEGAEGYTEDDVENGEGDTAVFDKLGGFERECWKCGEAAADADL